MGSWMILGALFKRNFMKEMIIQLLKSSDDEMVILGAKLLNSLPTEREQIDVFIGACNACINNRLEVIKVYNMIEREGVHGGLRNIKNLIGKYWVLYMLYNRVIMLKRIHFEGAKTIKL
jgi:hypothetical protein